MPPALARSVASIRASVFARLQPRIDAHLASGGALVPLQIGDSAIAPPEAAREAVARAAADDVAALATYGAIAGDARLRDAIAGRVRPLGGALADVDGARHVAIACGATHGLFAAARAVLDPGDEVLVATPCWPLAFGVLTAAGGVPVEVPVSQRLLADPSLDVGALLRARVTPRTRALYFVSPNNPDGRVMRPADLAAMAALAVERDLWVFADEVYADYAFARPHASIAALPGMRERTLVVGSFSKSHALAGLRIGHVVGPAPAIEAVRRVANHSVYTVPVIAQRAALAALGAGQGYLDDARASARGAHEIAVATLARRGFEARAAEGGHFLFVDFARLLAGRPLDALLERAVARGVLVAPGEAFGEGYATCARICVTATAPADLVRGLDALMDAAADL